MVSSVKVKTKVRVIILLLILVVSGFLWLRTGDKIAGVILLNYNVSEDGSEMSLKVGLVASMGQIRTLKTRDEGSKKYITFYSTYGFNSNSGANNEFTIQLNPSCDEIYFFSGSGEYKLKLLKDRETKEWEKPSDDR